MAGGIITLGEMRAKGMRCWRWRVVAASGTGGCGSSGSLPSMAPGVSEGISSGSIATVIGSRALGDFDHLCFVTITCVA